MLTDDQLAHAARMCQRVVTVDFEMDTTPLWDERWGYTQPRRLETGFGNVEQIEYLKDDLSITLLDQGTAVICRVGGFVESPQRATQIRDEVAESLGAVRMAESPRFAPVVEGIVRSAPQTDPANLFVLGDYSLEFASQQLPAEMIEAGSSSMTMVMFTSYPLPPRLRAADARPAE